MILYLKPPSVLIDLRKFNECSYSRLQFFINTDTKESSDDYLPESMTPGTKLDQVGHFVLRCLCLHEPAMEEFIAQKEAKLFRCRLKQYCKNSHALKEACNTVVKDVRSLSRYRELNPLHGIKEFPYIGSMLLSTLNSVCKLLKYEDVNHHFRMECHEKCCEITTEVPFQMCPSLVKKRLVRLSNGFACVPCSLWTELLIELFHHHYSFGLSMISRTLRFDADLDIRWTEMFVALTSMYQSHLASIKRARSLQSLTARMVDWEREYFPPCMSHLLTVLRRNHRLSYAWRYRFSLFLKDIGLSVEESIQFWKNEYSKSCSAASTCKHSWRENQRKYTYSIRHMYGLEGSRIIGRSKSCRVLQTMQLGARDEGGCPFVQFDEVHLLRTLADSVIDRSDEVREILALKAAGRASEACNLHMCTAISALRKNSQSQITIRYDSPLEYYFTYKNYASRYDNNNW